MTDPDRPPLQSPDSPAASSDRPASRPCRSEGVPAGPGKPRRSAWSRWLAWPFAYALLFALFTYQDHMRDPQAVAYTEFKAEVAANNVAEVFAHGNTIQGALRKPVALPDKKDRT